MRFLIFASFLPFCFLSSCQHTASKKKTAEYYFNRAENYKKKKNYPEALKNLFSIRKNFFDSPYNQKALLMTADIYFEQEKYPQALSAYKKYQNFYSFADQAYVLYQMSLAYKNQLPGRSDHDLTLADQALLKIDKLLSLNSPYQEKALKMKQEILNKKMEKELKTILFFEKLGWNQAGLKRAKRLLALYPNNPLKPQLLLASVRLAEKTNKNPVPFKTELLEKYPESPSAKSLQNSSFFTQIKQKLL